MADLDQALSRDAVSLICRSLSPFVVLGEAFVCRWRLQTDQMSVPACCWGTVRLMCVVIFSPPQARNHFGVMLDPIGTACTLPSLWKHFGWALTKGELEEAGLLENAGGPPRY